MKTLRLIYMAVAAIFLVASCDDDSMNTDKAKVSTVFGNGQVKVVVTDTSYNLSWEPYTIYAGGRLAICTQYDVFVTPVYFDDTKKELYEPPLHWHLITTVDSCCARVSKNSVDAIFDDNSYFAFCMFPSGIDLYYASDNNFILSQTLNSSGRESVLIGATADPNRGHVEVSGEGEENMRKIGETVELTAIAYVGYKFVQWNDGSTDNPRKLLVTEDVYLEALFEQDKPIDAIDIKKKYPGFNQWFLDAQNDNTNAYIADNEMVINIEGDGQYPWDERLTCFFQGQDGQTEGNYFKLEFDIMWEGANKDAGFMISATQDISAYDVNWNGVEGLNPSLNEAPEWDPYTIPANSEQTITWGGIINAIGKEYIGINFELTGLQENGKLIPNGKGTFHIRNMKVLINDKTVLTGFNY